MNTLTIAGLLLSATAATLSAQVKSPDCSGPEGWAASMAFVNLKNAGLTDNAKLDFTKTQSSRIASEPLAKGKFRQVHHVTFHQKDGQSIDVITVNDASFSECSESGVEVFVVSKRLGDPVRPVSARSADALESGRRRERPER